MKIIITLLTLLILTSCGFHTPYKSNAINFNITGNKDFAKAVNKKLDTSLAKKLTLKIKNVSKNKINQGFSNGLVSSYNLELVVNFMVYDADKMILSNQLSSSRFLTNYNNSANSYQDKKAYDDMQNELITKIIRKMTRL